MTVVPPTITTVSQAFQVLRLTGSVSTQEEIRQAFTRRVKEVAVAGGNYTADMDDLTQAKEFLLAALARAQEQARSDDARRRAQEGEREENRQRRAREKAQRERQAAEEQAKAQQDAELQQSQESPRLQEPASQSAPNQEQPAPETEQASQRSDTQPADLIEETLKLLLARRSELERTRQQECEARERLRCLQIRRSELEQTVQTASELVAQVCALLTGATPEA